MNISPPIPDPFGSHLFPPAQPNVPIISRPRRFLRDLVNAGTRGILLAAILVYFIAQAHIVHGYSMEPNLHTNQYLIVEKVSYHFEQPERGDVVVIHKPDSDDRLIKRVIALPGELIQIQGDHVYINGHRLSETYLPDLMSQASYGPFRVPEGHIFVMGDNRNNSNDSRFFGPVAFNQITGRAWVTYWPVEQIGFIK